MNDTRKFLDSVAIKLNIKTASDWGKVTRDRFFKVGGSSQLLKYYKGSLFSCLQSVYTGKENFTSYLKDIKWEREWFNKLPNSYWKSIENHKKLLDEIAIKLNIRSPSQWGKVTRYQVRGFGGGRLLNYYSNSLYKCLQSVYKGKFGNIFTYLFLKKLNGKENGFTISLNQIGSP